jgi:hypothetical protein
MGRKQAHRLIREGGDRRAQFVKSVERLGETIAAIDARPQVMKDWHAAERAVAAELNKLHRLH